MKLSERYRPRRLADIVGQPPVQILRRLVAEPYPCCRLLIGDAGCGKTTAVLAFAEELGCHDEFTDRHVIVGADLTVDVCREYWQRQLKFLARSESGFKVFIIEELEWLSPQTQVFLKDGLERLLPPRTIVLATSNGTGKLSGPLLQRFGSPLCFQCGEYFAQACQDRLQGIWRAESPGVPLPGSWRQWGWDEDHEQFSMRVCLDLAQDHLDLLGGGEARGAA